MTFDWTERKIQSWWWLDDTLMTAHSVLASPIICLAPFSCQCLKTLVTFQPMTKHTHLTYADIHLIAGFRAFASSSLITRAWACTRDRLRESSGMRNEFLMAWKAFNISLIENRIRAAERLLQSRIQQILEAKLRTARVSANVMQFGSKHGALTLGTRNQSRVRIRMTALA